MRLLFSLHLMRKRYWHLARALAILLLLHTGADLIMPQYFCGAEETAGPGAASNSVISSAWTNRQTLASVSSGDDNTRPDKPTPETPGDEDCFCCCAHVLPSKGFGLAATTELKTCPAPDTFDFIPSPPLRGTYRPPRCA